MIDVTNAQIDAPRHWQEFEDLCADLWRRLWDDPDTQKNGRGGQPQYGVDVFGRPSRGATYEGVQCKGKDARYGKDVTEDELRAEVEKAKKFEPRISKFTLATTAPNDQKIQAVARNGAPRGTYFTAPRGTYFTEQLALGKSDNAGHLAN